MTKNYFPRSTLRHGADDDQTLDDQLPDLADVHQDQTVGQHGDDQGADQGSENGPDAADDLQEIYKILHTIGHSSGIEIAIRRTGRTLDHAWRLGLIDGPRIHQLALRYVKNWEDAEEVTQDVLMKVHRKIDAFRGDAALSSWIYRITFNTAMSRLRSTRLARAADQEHERAGFVRHREEVAGPGDDAEGREDGRQGEQQPHRGGLGVREHRGRFGYEASANPQMPRTPDAHQRRSRFAAAFLSM